MPIDEDAHYREFWSPIMIAQRWGVSAEMVRSCIRSGELEGLRIGRRLFRVTAAKLADYEARRAAGATRPLTAEEREVQRQRDLKLRAIVLGAKLAREDRERAEAKRKEGAFVAELIDSVSRGGRD